MLVYSLPVNSRKWLAHDVYDTFVIHANLVYDISDISCWAQNGGTHGRVIATFKCQCSKGRARNQVGKLQHQ